MASCAAVGYRRRSRAAVGPLRLHAGNTAVAGQTRESEADGNDHFGTRPRRFVHSPGKCVIPTWYTRDYRLLRSYTFFPLLL
jgi:hypothetical protein